MVPWAGKRLVTLVFLASITWSYAQVSMETASDFLGKVPAREECKWSDWSQCTAPCGGGIQVREIEQCCHLCVTRIEARSCNHEKCSVDGQWGAWSAFGDCSASCGSFGYQMRSRNCDDPSPIEGGKPCEGPAVELRICQKDPCPVDGQWSKWCSCPSNCSAPCGGGNLIRTRMCNNPAPSNGGADCEGINQSEEICNAHACSVSGYWSAWSKWSVCNMTTCMADRSRACVGTSCDGDAREEKLCPAVCCFGQYRSGYSADPHASCNLNEESAKNAILL